MLRKLVFSAVRNKLLRPTGCTVDNSNSEKHLEDTGEKQFKLDFQDNAVAKRTVYLLGIK